MSKCLKAGMDIEEFWQSTLSDCLRKVEAYNDGLFDMAKPVIEQIMSQISEDSYTKDREGTINKVGRRFKMQHKLNLMRQHGMPDYKYYQYVDSMAIKFMHPNTANGIKDANTLGLLYKNNKSSSVLLPLIAEGDIHWTILLGEFEGIELPVVLKWKT